MSRDLGAALSALLSVLLHVSLMWWLVALPPAEALGRAVAESSAHARERAESALAARGRARGRQGEIPVEFGGPRSAQNVNRRAPGEGGEGRSPELARLLADDVDGVLLQDTPLNAVGVAQLQRIRTDEGRASWDNRRATPHPNDQAFLASGEGPHQERRPVSERDPLRGAQNAPRQSATGVAEASPAVALVGLQATTRATGTVAQPAATAGSDRASPGQGIARGQGQRESQAARVALGRPPVDEAPAATASSVRDRPRDNVDSELLATQLMQSWVDASPRSGAARGPGNGGVGGGGQPGSGGGRGDGGAASPHSPGPGGHGALDTRDTRYRSWLLAQRRRVQRAMVFPRERRINMDQGVVVYTFRVDARGQLLGQPRLARTSGFGDIDAAALRAILASLPASPPPPELMVGRADFPVRMHLDFSNPLVR